jgi:hypothetical protein
MIGEGTTIGGLPSSRIEQRSGGSIVLTPNGVDGTGIVVRESGSVGIGTTSPGARFEVRKVDGGNAFRFANFVDGGSLGAWAGTYAAEFRSVTSGTTHGVLINHNEANDARRVLDISDASGVFATFVNGKVGIGNSLPSYKLDVTGTTRIGATGSLLIASNDANTVNLRPGVSNGDIYITDDSGDPLRGITVANGGALGVGTATPGAKLEVAGQVKITGGSPANGRVLTSDATGLATWTDLSGLSGVTGTGVNGHVSYWTGANTQGYDNTGNFFWDATNDRLGIGTATPAERLQVTARSLFVNLMIGEGTTINGLPSSRIEQRSGGSIALDVNGSDNSGILIRETGDVGIGTVSPGRKLELYGTTPGIKINDPNASGNAFVELSTVDGGLSYFQNTGGRTRIHVGGGERMTFLNSGKIGINTTTPVTLFSILSGDADFTTGMSLGRTNTSNGKYVLTNSDNNVFRVAFASNTGTAHADYTNRMVIDANGNVGIGNLSAPAQKLEVNGGTIRATALGGSGTKLVQTNNSGDLSVSSLDPATLALTTNINGTTNYVPKFTGANTIGNSQIYDNGTNVGFGTTSPGNSIHIHRNGSTPVIQLYSDRSASSSSPNQLMENRILFGGVNNQGWSTPNGAGIDFYTNYPAETSTGRLNFWAYPNTSASPVLTVWNGSVGVGTASPLAPLQINAAQPTGTVTATAVGTRMMGQLDVQATDAYTTQKGGRITFSGVYNSGGALSTFAAIQGKKFNAVDNNSGGNLEFITGNNATGVETVNMIIDNTGNVNIPGLVASAAVYTDASKNLTTSTPTSGTLGYWTRSSTNLYNTTLTDNVGVGTNAPGYPFEVSRASAIGGWLSHYVNGASHVYLAHGSGYGIHINTGNTAAGQYALQVYNGSSNILYAQNDGNVGLGTGSPATRLDLATAPSNKPLIRFNPGSTTGVDYTGGYAHNDFLMGSYASGGYPQHYISNGYLQDGNRKFHIGTASDANFNGSTTFTPQFTFTSGGSLGLGTTGPAAKLHIFSGNPGSGIGPYYTHQLRIDNSADAGLTLTTPTANAAYLWHNTPLDGASAGIKFDGTSRYMAFFTVNGTERMRIDNVGNVGLGTASPGNALHIHRNGSTPILQLYSDRSGSSSSPAQLMEAKILFGGVNNQGWSTPNGAGIDFHTNYPAETSTGRLNFWAYPNSSASPVLTVWNGRVGVQNTSPACALDVIGPNTQIGGSNQGGVIFQAQDPNGRPAIQAFGNIDGSGFWDGAGAAINVRNQNGTGRSINTSGSIVCRTDIFVGTCGFWIGATWCSDKRWKKDIEPMHDVLGQVMKLQGVKYNWRTSEFPQMNFDSTRQIGFIAQEVEKLFPEVVNTNKEGYKTVHYEKLTAVLTEAMKEQQEEIECMKSDYEELKQENERLKLENERNRTSNEKLNTDVKSMKAQLDVISERLNIKSEK